MASISQQLKGTVGIGYWDYLANRRFNSLVGQFLCDTVTILEMSQGSHNIRYLRLWVYEKLRSLYRDALKGGPVLLCNSQAGSGINFTQPRAHHLVNLCIALTLHWHSGRSNSAGQWERLFGLLALSPVQVLRSQSYSVRYSKSAHKANIMIFCRIFL